MLFLACVVGLALWNWYARKPLASNRDRQTKRRLDNFRLVDDRDHPFELYAQSDARAIVLISYRKGCARLQRALPAIARLLKRFLPNRIRFFFIDARDKRGDVIQEAARNRIDVRYLRDDARVVSRDLGYSYCPEVVVVVPGQWSVAYRGPLADDTNDSTTPLTTRLEALLSGDSTTCEELDGEGCAMPLPFPRSLSYTGKIIPILRSHCLKCHENGNAPSLDRYEQIRKFAPMIRETLLTRRMPPTQLEVAFLVDYKKTDAMRPNELRTLIAWIDAGTPRDGDAPLHAPPSTHMAVVPPDFVWKMPRPHLIQATGEGKYDFEQVLGPIKKDMWLRTIRIEPTNRPAVHHQLLFVSSLPLAAYKPDVLSHTYGNPTWSKTTYFVASVHPGQPYLRNKTAIAWNVKRGSYLILQTHYHGIGRVSRDQTTIKIWYFHSHKGVVPRHVMKITLGNFRISAHAREVVLRCRRKVLRNLYLIHVVPHLHLRARSIKGTIVQADGQQRTFFSLPLYDFNFQRGYTLKKPLFVRAGSYIEAEAMFDNSSDNATNPNPDHDVTAGQLTDRNEMLRLTVHYLLPEELRGSDPSAAVQPIGRRTAVPRAATHKASTPTR